MKILFPPSNVRPGNNFKCHNFLLSLENSPRDKINMLVFKFCFQIRIFLRFVNQDEVWRSPFYFTLFIFRRGNWISLKWLSLLNYLAFHWKQLILFLKRNITLTKTSRKSRASQPGFFCYNKKTSKLPQAALNSIYGKCSGKNFVLKESFKSYYYY